MDLYVSALRHRGQIAGKQGVLKVKAPIEMILAIECLPISVLAHNMLASFAIN
jgi:hypothetical protein